MSRICLLTDQPILCAEDDVHIDDCHFHIRALAKNYVLSGSLENPCNRQELSEKVKDRVQAEARRHTIRGLYIDLAIVLSGLESVAAGILAILAKVGPIPEIVTSIDVQMNGVSLYSFDLSADLSTYLAPENEYLITTSRGLSPKGAYQMYQYTSKAGLSAIADTLLAELTNGTARKV